MFQCCKSLSALYFITAIIVCIFNTNDIDNIPHKIVHSGQKQWFGVISEHTWTVRSRQTLRMCAVQPVSEILPPSFLLPSDRLLQHSMLKGTVRGFPSSTCTTLHLSHRVVHTAGWQCTQCDWKGKRDKWVGLKNE